MADIVHFDCPTLLRSIFAHAWPLYPIFHSLLPTQARIHLFQHFSVRSPAIFTIFYSSFRFLLPRLSDFVLRPAASHYRHHFAVIFRFAFAASFRHLFWPSSCSSTYPAFHRSQTTIVTTRHLIAVILVDICTSFFFFLFTSGVRILVCFRHLSDSISN